MEALRIVWINADAAFFADRIDVNHWFLLSGILIICIAIVCPMITEIRKLDAK